MRRRGLFLILTVMITLVLGVVLTGAQPAPSQSERLVELDVIARLNAWRISEELAPFSENATLSAMALYHARYLSRLRTIPDGSAIHYDVSGDGILDRARYDQFNWPNYGRDEQLAIGEIAAVNHISGALGFWDYSAVHHRTVVNPVYREIGVAAIPRGFGRYIFVVVLGAQPNVLPVTYNPEDQQLYLTNENYRFVSGEGILKSAEKVRLFDSQGRSLTDWMAWSPKNSATRKRKGTCLGFVLGRGLEYSDLGRG